MTIPEERDREMALAEMVANKVLAKFGIVKDEITEREAWRIFGESEIRSLINQKYIRFVRGNAKNSPHTYSRIEIETVQRLIEEKKLK